MAAWVRPPGYHAASDADAAHAADAGLWRRLRLRHGYGYGYGGGPVIVTETTVHAAPVVETRTFYETVIERVRVKPSARLRCTAPPPRPRAGERG